MPDLVDEFVGQLCGGDALRAVARAAERHHQRRSLWLEVVERAGDDAGGRDGVDAAPEVAPERGGGDLTDERGAARAGEDDANAGATGDVGEKVVERGVGAVRDLAPDVGLLADLEN